VKNQLNVVEQMGFVEKALHLLRDLQKTCIKNHNDLKWNREQQHTLKWAERHILHAKKYIHEKFENEFP